LVEIALGELVQIIWSESAEVRHCAGLNSEQIRMYCFLQTCPALKLNIEILEMVQRQSPLITVFARPGALWGDAVWQQ
jgi:hypothetical protein